ncbi:hypothetical protein OUZ56_017193 [Daphnia magna]|uniref:Uncharacterized protein n=1 Tax=Daphnia magna TaxID=35525 RepID=A0ABR0ASJ6_9CRUS|nr:hypothetical protein OUZ56_017193 [Daphnia magna]
MGANVDDESDLNSEERLTVLTNYHDWIKGGYKENKKKQDAFRKFVKDLLLDGITVQVETELQNSSQTASTSDNVIFYIGGYMVNKIQKRSKCMTCIDSVKGGLESLPKDFAAQDLTELKSKGYLKFASLNLFMLLKVVEKEIQKKIDIDIITSLVEHQLPQISCQDHMQVFMTNIIMDFMCTRMKCIAKEKRLKITEDKRVKEKSTRKEKKL